VSRKRKTGKNTGTKTDVKVKRERIEDDVKVKKEESDIGDNIPTSMSLQFLHVIVSDLFTELPRLKVSLTTMITFTQITMENGIFIESEMMKGSITLAAIQRNDNQSIFRVRSVSNSIFARLTDNIAHTGRTGI
jgi:hypothetical protein